MTDVNGRDINVGDRVVILKGDCVIPNGAIGDVRDIRDSVGALRNKPGVRVTKGPEGYPEWSAWCGSDEVAVV